MTLSDVVDIIKTESLETGKIKIPSILIDDFDKYFELDDDDYKVKTIPIQVGDEVKNLPTFTFSKSSSVHVDIEVSLDDPSVDFEKFVEEIDLHTFIVSCANDVKETGNLIVNDEIQKEIITKMMHT